MKVIGMDPGSRGAFAVVDNGKLLSVDTFPKTCGKLSLKRLTEKLMTKSLGVDLIIIEKVHAIPGSSAKATFSFGRNFQFCIDAASYLNIPISFTTPKEWQKLALKDEKVKWVKRDKKVDNLRMKRDTKRMAYNRARSLFPHEEFLSSSRATVFHDGLVDAALIAYYGPETKLEPMEG